MNQVVAGSCQRPTRPSSGSVTSPAKRIPTFSRIWVEAFAALPVRTAAPLKAPVPTTFRTLVIWPPQLIGDRKKETGTALIIGLPAGLFNGFFTGNRTTEGPAAPRGRMGPKRRRILWQRGSSGTVGAQQGSPQQDPRAPGREMEIAAHPFAIPGRYSAVGGTGII